MCAFHHVEVRQVMLIKHAGPFVAEPINAVSVEQIARYGQLTRVRSTFVEMRLNLQS